MSWQKLENENHILAETGRMRLNCRISHLATVRANGTPRVHPVTPIIGEGRLFVFMEPTSPKGKDLVRGSRFALHCGVEDNSGGGGEFYVSGNGRSPNSAIISIQARCHMAIQLTIDETLVEGARTVGGHPIKFG
jgi:hypothetical protein